MLSQSNPYYFASEIHNSGLDYVIANMPGSITSENLSNVIYSYLVQEKIADVNFYSFTPSIKSGFSIVYNQLATKSLIPIPDSFNTIFNAFINPSDHAAELKVIANSISSNLILNEIDRDDKIMQMIGLAIYPDSLAYWKEVKDNVTNPWHVWAIAEGGPEIFSKLIIPDIAKADILGAIGGLFKGRVFSGHTGEDLVIDVLQGCIAGSVMEIVKQVFL